MSHGSLLTGPGTHPLVGGEQRDRYRATYARQRNTPRNWKCPGWRAGSVLVSRLRSLGWNFMPKNRVNFLGWWRARLVTNIRPDLCRSFAMEIFFLPVTCFSAISWKPWRSHKGCDYIVLYCKGTREFIQRYYSDKFPLLLRTSDILNETYTNVHRWKKSLGDGTGARGEVLRLGPPYLHFKRFVDIARFTAVKKL